MKDKLFQDFPALSKHEWIKQIEADLGGKDFEKKLIHKVVENLSTAPFYHAEDAKNTEWLKPYQNKINPKPEIPGISPRYWSNVAAINIGNEQSANKEMLELLQTGADGILLNLTGGENFERLLQGVQPEFIQLFLKPKEKPIKTLKTFFDWVENSGFEKETISGGLLFDSFSNNLEKEREREEIVKEAIELLKLGKNFPNFKVLGINTALYHNSGADAVQEIAYAISAFIELLNALTDRNHAATDIFDNIILQSAVGSDYFLEMAKIKVLRIVTHQLSGLYNVDLAPEKLFIFSSTSYWSKTALDVHSNMIRNTIEAMSAILGGCNALQVLQHDIASDSTNAFSKRIALNTASILKEESYLDKVLDPVSGSYYLENLIDGLFQLVKNKLLEIESGGGWWEYYQNLTIQKEIKTTRNGRMDQLAEQKKIKIGVNKFIDSGQEKVDLISLEELENTKYLFPIRESYKAEKLTFQKS